METLYALRALCVRVSVRVCLFVCVCVCGGGGGGGGGDGGESIDHRWIPLLIGQLLGLWSFLWCQPKQVLISSGLRRNDSQVTSLQSICIICDGTDTTMCNM